MTTDGRIPLIVVATLAIGVRFGVATMGYLAVIERAVPGQFDRLVTFLAGGLAGILATTRGGDEPQQVTVTNSPQEPVPVEDTAP